METDMKFSKIIKIVCLCNWAKSVCGRKRAVQQESWKSSTLHTREVGR